MHEARQLQHERLQFFSDAVFAIAITLLVIEIRVPHVEPATEAGLRDGLLGLFPNYIGFVVSFFVIGRFWIGHHRIFGYLKDWDNRLVQINMLFLATIAFLPFPTAVVGEYGGARTAVAFYAFCLILAGLANLALIQYIRHHPTLLAAPLTPPEIHALRSSWLPLIIGVSALIAAFVTPLAGLAVLMVGPLVFVLLMAWWGRRYRSQ